METGNFSPYALTLYNYKLFESFKRQAESPNDPSANILCLKDLYEFIDNNFAELHNKNNLMNILPILHYTIQLESKDTTVKTNICEFFQMLLDKYDQREDDQKIVLQIYYQLLKSLPDQSNILNSMTDELFQTLCNILTRCSKLLAANIIVCLKLQITELRRIDLLRLLWQKVTEMHTNENLRYRLAQIMVQFIEDFLQYIDNFYKNDILEKIVKILLVSAVREERKIAIYLLKHIIPNTIQSMQDIISAWEVNSSDQLNNSWQLYITVFENLEEKQSHLILPTLETVKNIKLAKKWLDLLYSQLLTHNNSLVLRWSIEYMLENFVSNDLSRELLKQFLQAANTTNLYNYDNYCLSTIKIKQFLNCDLSLFFDVCTDINWKSVPLHFWLKQLDVEQLKDYIISKETLIKLASKVRVLQNKAIRGHLIQIFEKSFECQIEKLGIEEYLQLIDNLYNVSDYMYYSFSNLTKQVQKNSNNVIEFKLTQRLYEIVHIRENDKYLEEQETLLDVFQNIPKEHHSWFRFMIVFDFKNSAKQIEFCQNKYGIDFSKMNIDNLDASNEARISTLVDKLVWDKSEESFVHEKSIDYCVLQCTDISQLISWSKYSTVEILDKGGKNTLVHIAELIVDVKEAIDVLILDKIIKEVPKYNKHVCFEVLYQNLFRYISQHILGDKVVEYVDKILCNDIDDYYALKAFFCSNVLYANFNFVKKNGSKEFLHNLFEREAPHGDVRVEKRYEYELEIDQPRHFLHHALVDYIIKWNIQGIELEFLNYLLCINRNVRLMKPRYFENSHEHRIKLRVWSCFIRVIRKSIYEYGPNAIWNLICMENNQLNITIFYERIIVNNIKNINEILDKLKKIRDYSPSQQVSIIAICCMYCITSSSKISNINIDEVIQKLLSLTMGANFQTRLYSQLAIYKILDSGRCGTSNNTNILKTAIKEAIGDQLSDLLNDIRLEVNKDNILNDDIILYVTNAAFDEVNTISQEIQEKYAKCRELYSKKISTIPQKNNSEKSSDTEICNVQRKMNPLTDIMPADDLISYPEFKMKKIKEDNVIVLASLIDKLPNLGGIARTCEVLGIKNLVINSSKHIEKDDFKNLSMTAEKALNISEIKPDKLMEFLVQKQIEGYEIVGAEQTAQSQSFVDFKFPKKCIILLGHEKEGIPANILSILNHTVEIPQFGMVRSLNVHVTGALFMWEYCKQHIVLS